MAYEVFLTPSAQRSLKKLPQPIANQLVTQMHWLKTNPLLGQSLEGKQSFLRSLHTVITGTHYRVAYEVHEKTQEIAVYYLGSRENFYRRLSKLRLKPGQVF